MNCAKYIQCQSQIHNDCHKVMERYYQIKNYGIMYYICPKCQIPEIMDYEKFYKKHENHLGPFKSPKKAMLLAFLNKMNEEIRTVTTTTANEMVIINPEENVSINPANAANPVNQTNPINPVKATNPVNPNDNNRTNQSKNQVNPNVNPKVNPLKRKRVNPAASSSVLASANLSNVNKTIEKSNKRKGNINPTASTSSSSKKAK